MTFIILEYSATPPPKVIVTYIVDACVRMLKKEFGARSSSCEVSRCSSEVQA